MKTWTSISLFSLIAASGIPAAHAEILISMPGPMAGVAWFGEQQEREPKR